MTVYYDANANDAEFIDLLQSAAMQAHTEVRARRDAREIQGTMARDLVDVGALPATNAARSPMANVLSSAIGADKTAPVVTRLDADWKNVHLLCSDGLTKHVSDERIAEVLGSMTSSQQAAE